MKWHRSVGRPPALPGYLYTRRRQETTTRSKRLRGRADARGDSRETREKPRDAAPDIARSGRRIPLLPPTNQHTRASLRRLTVQSFPTPRPIPPVSLTTTNAGVLTSHCDIGSLFGETIFEGNLNSPFSRRSLSSAVAPEARFTQSWYDNSGDSQHPTPNPTVARHPIHRYVTVISLVEITCVVPEALS